MKKVLSVLISTICVLATVVLSGVSAQDITGSIKYDALQASTSFVVAEWPSTFYDKLDRPSLDLTLTLPRFGGLKPIIKTCHLVSHTESALAPENRMYTFTMYSKDGDNTVIFTSSSSWATVYPVLGNFSIQCPVTSIDKASKDLPLSITFKVSSNGTSKTFVANSTAGQIRSNGKFAQDFQVSLPHSAPAPFVLTFKNLYSALETTQSLTVTNGNISGYTTTVVSKFYFYYTNSGIINCAVTVNGKAMSEPAYIGSSNRSEHYFLIYFKERYVPGSDVTISCPGVYFGSESGSTFLPGLVFFRHSATSRLQAAPFEYK